MAKDRLGKILYMNLSNGSAIETDVSEGYGNYLGGMGIANYLASQYINEGIASFSASNPIIIAAGTLAGTPAPSTSRTAAVTLMPLNGFWGSANGGGGFAARLKWAGYEAVVITGRSSDPVYLLVDNGQVTIRSASELWGKGVLETTEILWQLYKGSSVIAIGPAGEKKVAFALALIDNMATLGRGGLGAVMGDKGLKAIVVRGQQLPFLADKSKFLTLSRDVYNKMCSISWRDQWKKYGVYLGWDRWKEELSTGNFTKRLPREQIELLNPQAYSRHFIRSLACISCPMSDKAVVKVDGCNYPISYGLQAAMAGARWGAENIREALSGMIEANDYGVDDLTLYAVVGWAVDLYQRGIITRNDTDKVLEHTPEHYRHLAQDIVNRQGLGDMLAEGFLANVDRFGKDALRLAFQIKGMDLISDPRPHSSGFLFSQLTNPRGPYVVQGNSPAFTPKKKPSSLRSFLRSIGVDKDKAEKIASDEKELDLALLVRYTEDWYAAASSLGFCARQPVIQCYDPETAAGLVAAALGMEFDGARLLQVGERVWNRYRLNNNHQGSDLEVLPDKLYQKLEVPGGESYQLKNYEQRKQIIPEYVEDSLKRYYRERGWGRDGRVTAETKKRLQLS